MCEITPPPGVYFAMTAIKISQKHYGIRTFNKCMTL